MGCLYGPKYDKNHRKRKMFSFGIKIERVDLTINAHTQIRYVSATVKKYEKTKDNGPVTKTGETVSDMLPADPDNG